MTQIAEATFYEKINISKLNYILNNPAKYEKQIKEQEKAMRRLNKHYTKNERKCYYPARI